MAEVGILHKDSRIELIEGRIVDMASVGSAHMAAVNRLNRLLTGSHREGSGPRPNPVRLDTGSEPLPDIALLR
ncbi:MAG: Uma2 family endonuclease [Acetobacteraceae bacterium]|nr:Uma2 family endonuclease [Acetobacteraceae bacterium]